MNKLSNQKITIRCNSFDCNKNCWVLNNNKYCVCKACLEEIEKCSEVKKR